MTYSSPHTSNILSILVHTLLPAFGIYRNYNIFYASLPHCHPPSYFCLLSFFLPCSPCVCVPVLPAVKEALFLSALRLQCMCYLERSSRCVL
ncbi:hypothetical protein AG1IA_00615 [Rhizoctonia solani AG-1 IA]|uniref:Uncharacterized protein n=1 Tax=Thanatephorus cucumeris (strain AG1-IA) TaxID=983506 RepID=L8X8G7_THACA|nr:hypothetical protein AG1IA_00615 [Rhizoctonia solani AG-1 IA]